MDCIQVRQAVWESDERPDAVRTHLTACGACRAEAGRAQQLLATLFDMREDVADVPSTLESRLLSQVPSSVLQRARAAVVRPGFWRNAAATAGAVAAAAAA